MEVKSTRLGGDTGGHVFATRRHIPIIYLVMMVMKLSFLNAMIIEILAVLVDIVSFLEYKEVQIRKPQKQDLVLTLTQQPSH